MSQNNTGTKTSDKWISVRERFPKNDKDVIVWDRKLKCFRKDYYSRKNGTDGWANSKQDSITYWMPESLFNKMISKTIPPTKTSNQ